MQGNLWFSSWLNFGVELSLEQAGNWRIEHFVELVLASRRLVLLRSVAFPMRLQLRRLVGRV